ncbi:MAG: DUF72 domain-containing protein [Spirochaetes bacterium]|nr:DUF72 domain-containing protein [Spirochaetota bacterium]
MTDEIFNKKSGLDNRGTVHIGTSGWNYAHWRGPFYPKGLSTNEWLSFYAEKFSTVEINNSFYRLPEKATFEKWRDRTPDGFLFSVKANRYITHMKKLKDPYESLSKFLQNVEGLGNKLGPVLFQLPPSFAFNYERLKEFLEALPKQGRHTFEFRNHGWFNEKTLELLSRYGAAFCIYHLGGVLSPIAATADFVYVRLHGPGSAYRGEYDSKTLQRWALNITEWMEEGRDVFCYFDNDEQAYALKDAVKLERIV